MRPGAGSLKRVVGRSAAGPRFVRARICLLGGMRPLAAWGTSGRSSRGLRPHCLRLRAAASSGFSYVGRILTSMPRARFNNFLSPSSGPGQGVVVRSRRRAAEWRPADPSRAPAAVNLAAHGVKVLVTDEWRLRRLVQAYCREPPPAASDAWPQSNPARAPARIGVAEGDGACA